MSFVRPNIYRMVLDGSKSWRDKQELCMEFGIASGAPWAVAWVETNVPEAWVDGGANGCGWTPGRLEKSDKIYVYGREILEKKRITNADMATYSLCEALGRESVVGREAATLVHAVLFDWFIRGPKTRSKPLAKAAPEWWARVTRSD